MVEVQDDPFLWDEDRVVQELCTSNRSWRGPPAKKLPDPAALEAKLRECGVDGEVLLTYGDELGFNSLWKHLGIKKLPHQLSLKDAIASFQKRSPQYRKWKAHQLAGNQTSDDEDHDSPIKSESHTLADLELPAHASPALARFPGPEVQDIPQARPILPGLALPSQAALTPALSPSTEPASPVTGIPKFPDAGDEVVQEPPTKRRKSAPTSISAEPTLTAAAAIPTEADIFMQDSSEEPQANVSATGSLEEFLEATDSSGFLGAKYLRLDKLTNSEDFDDTDTSDHEFSLARQAIPPGRRIQVSAFMKRFLRLDRVGRLDAIQNPEDEPLPVFGESDDESVDSETWREYEEEEKERLAMEAMADSTKARTLSQDHIREAIANAIRELEAQWLLEKKPKYDRKAWRTWQDARRNPDRLALISSAKKFLDQVETRIERITEEILKTQWTIEENVARKFSAYLETNVFEKKYQAWYIDVLESPRQPSKPAGLPKPAPKPPKPKVLNGDEESLSSDSDDIDDFIEYDDSPDLPLPVEEMDVDSDLAMVQPGSPARPVVDDFTITAEEEQNNTTPTQSTPSSGSDDNSLPLPQSTPRRIKSEQKPVSETPYREVIDLIESSPSPIQQLNEVPGLDDCESVEKIGEVGVAYWEHVQDAERLVVAVLCDWSFTTRGRIADAINNYNHEQIWAKYMWPTILDPRSTMTGSLEIYLARLFDVFISKNTRRLHKPNLKSLTFQRIEREEMQFPAFYDLLKRIMPKFLPGNPRTPTRIVVRTPSKEMDPNSTISDTQAPAKEPSTSDSDGSSSVDMPVPPIKKRRRHKRRDKAAANLRKDHFKTTEEHARRARQLRERLAELGSVPINKSRLIVNETKESDDLGLIYINDDIGARIKDHQIEGVRFMWNQVVVESKVRQGCLLAHTMGLGKTMQVITLLVVIAEASSSPDPSIRSQIPQELRQSKTLVLCPAALVENWFEEILKWAPAGLLGKVWRVDATLPVPVRIRTVREWASSGGVLIVGYAMFTVLVKADEETAGLLQETPNLVIGDEAHYMKNPDSQRHQAAANFKTMSRIAMTGSPLTNHVMDYYAMINWVAPNYLADIAEFSYRFANPIRDGLYADSEPHLKRKARKQLQVLKETVDPKVHRRDIHVLLNELPTKKEFIISLPLTKLQRSLYETYVDWVVNSNVTDMAKGQAGVWSLVSRLGLVLAHPFIFKTEAEEEKQRQHKRGAAPAKMAKAGEDSGEADEAKVELPQDVLINMLATVAVREIESYALSNKIVVLLRILDECKKVGDKVLVFSQRIPTLNYLENIFKRQRIAYQRLDSKTPPSERQKSIRKFNADANSVVYLISTKAGGVGLNIYGANRVVIFDFKYTPSDEQQAIGRAYRLGQTKPVYVYWLTVGGTFEDTIHNNAIFKTQLASRVVDKKNPSPYSKRFSEYFTMPKDLDQEDLSKAFGQDEVLDALLKSNDTGNLIRKITSTETFEKEETYELTAEDQQEVKAHIELERLRITNPEEYKRREHERIWQSRTELGMPPPPLNFHQPRSADSEFPAAPPPTSSRRSTIVRLKVPEHMREKRDAGSLAPTMDGITSTSGHGQGPVLPIPSLKPNDEPPQPLVLTCITDIALVNSVIPDNPFISPQFPRLPTGSAVPISAQPALNQGTAAPTTNEAAPAQQEDPSGTMIQEVTTDLQPILATGTHYKLDHSSSPSAPQDGLSISGSHNIPPSFTAAPVLKMDFEGLSKLHKQLRQERGRVRYSPSDLFHRVEAVLAERDPGKLPLMDKLQNLQIRSRDPRFAEAMLAGHIDPEQLASMTRAEMEEMSTSLNALSEADFKQRVWTTKADLSHLATKSKTSEKRRTSTADGTGETSGSGGGARGGGGGAGGGGNRLALLRFIGRGSRYRSPATPPPPRDGQTAQPGDSAESPHIID